MRPLEGLAFLISEMSAGRPPAILACSAATNPRTGGALCAASSTAESGLSPSYVRSPHHGMAGVQQNISYKKELFAGDAIEIRTQVLEITEKRMCVRHEMRNIETGAVTAVSDITSVHLDKQAHKSS